MSSFDLGPISYFSTRENSPVDAFTATRSLAVSRSVP
jgi:hypothetical protein